MPRQRRARRRRSRRPRSQRPGSAGRRRRGPRARARDVAASPWRPDRPPGRDGVGRARCSQDPAVRIVTLLGPGGMGKTRLALAIADALRAASGAAAAEGRSEREPLRVVVVPLSTVTDDGELLASIAQVARRDAGVGRARPSWRWSPGSWRGAVPSWCSTTSSSWSTARRRSTTSWPCSTGCRCCRCSARAGRPCGWPRSTRSRSGRCRCPRPDDDLDAILASDAVQLFRERAVGRGARLHRDGRQRPGRRRGLPAARRASRSLWSWPRPARECSSPRTWCGVPAGSCSCSPAAGVTCRPASAASARPWTGARSCSTRPRRASSPSCPSSPADGPSMPPRRSAPRTRTCSR